MAIYYITGIRKVNSGSHTYISEVNLHLVEGNTVNKAALIDKNRLIDLIKARNAVYTAIWNYNNISWSQGETVSYETIGGREYLRSTPDSQRRDNLLHILQLRNLGL